LERTLFSTVWDFRPADIDHNQTFDHDRVSGFGGRKLPDYLPSGDLPGGGASRPGAALARSSEAASQRQASHKRFRRLNMAVGDAVDRFARQARQVEIFDLIGLGVEEAGCALNSSPLMRVSLATVGRRSAVSEGAEAAATPFAAAVAVGAGWPVLACRCARCACGARSARFFAASLRNPADQFAGPRPSSSDYIPDFIIGIFEPIIFECIFCIVILHPRGPSLAIAALIIARCLFISHLCGPSGIPPIIVVIFDISAPEHDIISAEAGLNARTAPARTAAETITYFIVNLMRETVAR
jgi:hypothetical protein